MNDLANLEAIRFMLNDELNQHKDQNRIQANRTEIRAAAAIVTYRRLCEVQEEIDRMNGNHHE